MLGLRVTYRNEAIRPELAAKRKRPVRQVAEARSLARERDIALNGELFWFKTKEISVIIQPAGHIIEARMRAMLANVFGEFQEGHELDDKTAKKVPKAMIGRLLSRKETTELLRKLG